MKQDEGPISHNGRMVDRSRIVDGLCAISDCLDGFKPIDNEYYQEVIEAAKDHLLED
jgi:hypothetical protein